MSIFLIEGIESKGFFMCEYSHLNKKLLESKIDTFFNRDTPCSGVKLGH